MRTRRSRRQSNADRHAYALIAQCAAATYHLDEGDADAVEVAVDKISAIARQMLSEHDQFDQAILIANAMHGTRW